MTKLVAALAIAAVIAIIILADRGLAAPLFGRFYAYPGGDKVAHFLILGTLTFVVTAAFPHRRRIAGRQVLLAPLIILLLISLEELSQGFVAGRSLDALDWLANLAGIVVGGTLAAWWVRRRTVTEM
jgi:VanZ family protein